MESNKANLVAANSYTQAFAHLNLDVASGAEIIGIDLSASIEQRWAAAIDQEDKQKRHFAALGLLLLSIKNDENIKHGEFLPELERRGFEIRDAQNAMSYARYVFTQTKAKQEQLLRMSKTKVCALASADPEVIEALFDGDEQKIMQVSVRGLLNELKAVQANQTKMQTALNDAETLLAAASKKRQLSDLKPATNIIREEALANVGTVQYGFAGLQKLWDEVDAEFADAPEHLLRKEQLWFAVHGAVSFGLKTLAHIAALAPEGMPTEISAAHVLTPEEADHWEQEWLTIQAGFKHKEAQRHDARVAELPRGRGRPAGSKNKDVGAGA